MKTTAKHNLIGLTMLGLFMIGGNAEAQTAQRATAEDQVLMTPAQQRNAQINFGRQIYNHCMADGAMPESFCACTATMTTYIPAKEIVIGLTLAKYNLTSKLDTYVKQAAKACI